MIDMGIYKMDDIRVGATLNLQAFSDLANYGHWYNGDFNELFSKTPTIDNALKTFDFTNMYKFNLFKIGSDAFANAALGEYPILQSENPQIDEWFKNGPELMMQRAIRQAARDWSIYGRSAIIVQRGIVINIPATDYIRVGELTQPDELVGHMIAHRYYERLPSETVRDAMTRAPNRLKLIRYAPKENINDSTIFEFHGQGLTGVVGRIIEGPVPAGIEAIATIGTGESWIERAKEAAELAMIEAIFSSVITHNNWNPITLVPAQIHETPSLNEMPKTTVEILADLRTMLRPVLAMPSQPNPVEVGEINTTGDSGLAQANFDNAMNMFAMAAHLPPTVFGVDIGRGESGIAKEIINQSFVQEVSSFRSDTSHRAPAIVQAIPDAPEGKFTYFWPLPVLYKKSEAVEQARTLRAAGIISVDEARNMIGLFTSMTDQTPAPESEE